MQWRLAFSIVLSGVALLSSGKFAGAEPGWLVIVGGGGTPTGVLRRTLDLAGGEDAQVCILPQASARDDAGQGAAKEFRKLGAKHVAIVGFEDREQAKQQIAGANLIWFPGGQQSRLMEAIQEAGLAETIRRRHREGLTIGGTSAGAAVMSEVMIPRMPEKPALRAGNTPTSNGLGLLADLIIDQHFVERRRMNRLLGAVLDNPHRVGVGISEGTAILVRGKQLSVVGKGSVVVVDPRKADVESAKAGQLQSARRLRVDVLHSGQQYVWSSND